MKTAVDFVEDKNVDWGRVTDLLSISKKENHWANFGPVSKMLEAHIQQMISLSRDATVVATASGTSALEALSQAVQYMLGRKPRWIVSSFGFFSTHRGEFRDSLVIDCDEHGLLSLAEMDKVSSDEYDGFVFTNIFGLCNDVSQYIEYANVNDKYLIIDNAAGLSSLSERFCSEKIMEAVSFHHTKPYGFGEGGCAIVHESIEAIVESVLNYGVGLDKDLQCLGFNGKISDPACALILQRIEKHASWSVGYVEQSARIRNLAEKSGLSPLMTEYDSLLSIPGQLPFLADCPISSGQIENPYMKLRKYYRPHDRRSLRANDIYDRIVNVPCHPGMEALDDDVIGSVLTKIASV